MAGIIWAAAAVALIVAIELSLRSRFGLGSPLLYVADESIGYLAAPNQTLRRFGNTIYINAFSMRTPEISANRSPDTLRILLLGDSIAFGSQIDQTDIISEQLRRRLAQSRKTVEVLNASASSWSPRNELAYLQRFGCFEAQIVVLLLNTDDLFGAAPSSAVVGRDRHYPDRKPLGAIAELLSRYWFQPKSKQSAESGDVVGVNLQAIEQIDAIAKQADAAFILAMTPLLRELEAGSRDYEAKARQRLQQLTEQLQIPYVDFLDRFQTAPAPTALYTDSIHLSSAGNQLVSDVLRQAIANVSRH